MRKKILSGILVLAMMLTMIPTAFAEDTGAAGKEDNKTEWVDGSECKDEKCTHEAAIGNKHYSTLENALKAVEDATATTIKLLANAEVNSTINVGIAATEEKSAAVAQKITLDLNGKTLTSKASSGAAVSLCVEGSSFTLIGGGKLVAANCEGIEVLKDKCSVTIGKGVTVSAGNFPVEVYPRSSDISSAKENWVATIAIYGTIVNTKSNPESSDGAGVYTSGNWKTVNVTIGEGAHITGAKKDGAYVTEAVYAAAGGTLTVNGGYMEGNNGIYAKGANVIINGGKIVGSAAAAKHECKDGGTIGSGDGVVIDNCKGINNYQTGSVTIKGGEISGTKNAVAAYAKEDAKLPTVTITGGTFNTDPRMQMEVDSVTTNTIFLMDIENAAFYDASLVSGKYVVSKSNKDTAVMSIVSEGETVYLPKWAADLSFFYANAMSNITINHITINLLKDYTMPVITESAVENETVVNFGTLHLGSNVKYNGNNHALIGNISIHDKSTELTDAIVSGNVTVTTDKYVVFHSGEVYGSVDGNAAETNAQTTENENESKLVIENGTFHNSVTANVIENGKFAGTVTANTIKGGLFMVKPEADAIAEGYRVVTTTKDSYKYEVVVDETPADVVIEVDGSASEVTKEAKQEFADKVGSTVTKETINTVVSAVESIEIEDAQSVAEDFAIANKNVINAVDSDTHEVAVKADVTVKPVDYSETTDGEGNTVKNLTVDIDMTLTIEKTEKKGGAKPTTLATKTGKDLVGTAVTVRIPLPTGFANENDEIFVTHKGYVYKCTVKKDSFNKLYISFTNTHGFSEFVLSTTNDSGASIDGECYETYDKAMSAVTEGAIVTIEKTPTGKISLSNVPSNVKTFYVVAGDSVRINMDSFTNAGFTCVLEQVNGKVGYKFTRTSSGSYVPTIPGNVPGSTIVTPGKTEDNTENDLSMSYDDAVAYVATMKDMSEGAWYYDMVVSAVQKGIIRGTGNAFSPDKSMTLYETLTVLARFDGEGIDGASWLEDAKAWALDNEILTKAEDESDISRERLVYLLYTYAKKTGVDVSAKGDLSKFTDAADVSDWAVEAMTWAVGEGIINGMYDELKPADTTTRAQVSTVLVRYADVIAD